MAGHHQGDVEAVDQVEDVLAVVAPEDAVFVLDDQEVEATPVKVFRRGAVGGAFVAGQDATHFPGVVVGLSGILDGDDFAEVRDLVRIEVAEQGTGQGVGKGCDAAGFGRVVAENGDLHGREG